MSVITDILSSPVKGVLDGAADIISKFVKDPTEALQAQVQLAKMDGDLKVALVNADQQFANSQAAVIEAEEKEGWLAANWRPLIMLLFGFIILNNYVLDPWFHIGKLDLPPDMWSLLKIGMGGYIMGRSVEKFLPDAVDSFGTAVANFKNTTPSAQPSSVIIPSDYLSRIADASQKHVLPKE